MANEFPFFIKIKGIDEISGTISTLQGKLKNLGGTFQSLGTKLSLGFSLPVFGAATLAVKDYMVEAEALAQVQAGLASTNNKVGLSFAQIQEEASRLQEVSLFGDEDILGNVSARLLTFTNITGQRFLDAQKAILDFSSKTKVELKAATTIIGKALNNPIKGLNALGKVGITFTDSQKNQIKTLVESGKIMEAQAIILKKIELGFGGSAKAAADTNPYIMLANVLSDVVESFGQVIHEGILPFVPAIKELAKTLRDLPVPAKQMIVAVLGIAAVIGPVIFVVGSLAIAFGSIGTLMPLLTTGIGIMTGAFGFLTTGIIKLASVLSGLLIRSLLFFFTNPVGLPILAIAAAVGVLTYAIIKNWDWIKKMIDQFLKLDLVQNVIRMVGTAFKFLSDMIGLSVQSLNGFLSAFKMPQIGSVPRFDQASFNVSPIQTGSILSQQQQGNANIVVDFKNLPTGTSVQTKQKNNVNLDLNMGYSMVGFS